LVVGLGSWAFKTIMEGYKSPLRGVPLDLILMVREQVASSKFKEEETVSDRPSKDVAHRKLFQTYKRAPVTG